MEFSQSYREMSILRKISRFFKLIGLRFKARKESRKEAHRIHKENRGLLKEEHHATSEQNKMDIKAKREEYKANVKSKRREKAQREECANSFNKVQQLMRVVNHNIFMKMRQEQNSSNVLEVSLIINQYHNLSRTIRHNKNRKQQKIKTKKYMNLLQQQQDVKLEALYIQRTILDELISRNKVTNEVATQLRENINYNEIVLAHEVSNAH